MSDHQRLGGQVSTLKSVPGRPGTIAYQPGYETTAAKIVELIRDAGLRPGDRLPTEQALADQLGVSRTIVREAVKLLSATSIVQARRGSGLYVAAASRPFAAAVIDLSMPVDPEHMLSLFEFRCMLEMQTVLLAAERITLRELRSLQEAVSLTRQAAETENRAEFEAGDAAFHQGIAEASRNPFLTSAVATSHRLQRWAISMVLAGAPSSLRVAAEEHAAILSAISDGQGQAAATLMQTHVQTTATAYQHEVRKLLTGASASD
jgi:DNA-binding FadR family transcriptional regulator